ncbi:MAG: ribosome maturation factor RimM [Clostridia bacterium]
MTGYFRIAVISRPHGIHGALKLNPLTDDLNRFLGLKFAYLERGSAYERVGIESVSVGGGNIIMTIEGVSDRTAAERLKNIYLCVDRAHAVTLKPGEFFYEELYGCLCFDTDGICYGELTDVIFTGANDVFEIIGEKKLLIPALKKLLTKVDTDNKRIILNADVLKEVGLFED